MICSRLSGQATSYIIYGQFHGFLRGPAEEVKLNVYHMVDVDSSYASVICW